MTSPSEFDALFRNAVGQYLSDLGRSHGDDVPWASLASGFTFGGAVVPLIGASGIWRPAILPDMPISITTSPIRPSRPRPYEDNFETDDLLLYRYRGTDANHRDNVGLRRAMERRAPLAYFHGTAVGWYAVAFPVFVVDDDRATRTFRVAVDAAVESLPAAESTREDEDARRAYVTRMTKYRLHQQGFRRRVLSAYRSRCSVCSLHRDRLLDAAHILADSDPRSVPVVSSGLSLCKLHHAAYDADMLGISPDLTVELKLDVLREKDGPMLLHGLQGFQGKRLIVPSRESQRPNREFLAERYATFLRAG